MEDNDILNAATAESGLKLLAHRRRENDEKLKSRFERIFEKYEYDFDGVGDEIDIVTGEVLVDNGHLKNMRDEADSDAGEPSWQAIDRLEEPSSSAGPLDVGLNDLTASGVDISGRGGRVDTATESIANDRVSSVLDAFARPAPRLARLLVNQGDVLPQSNLNLDLPSGDVVNNALPAEHRLEGQETAQLSSGDMMQSLLRSNPVLAQLGLDTNAIQALGLSIATGLMKLMSPTSSTGAVRKETNPSIEKAWNYPEPGHAPRAKRKMPDGGDIDKSDRQRKRMSLWAPRGTRSPRKQAMTVSAGPSSSHVQFPSTQMATQQPDRGPNERAPNNEFVIDRETGGTSIRQETPVKRISTLEYVSSLDPSQNTDELSLIETLRSECAMLNLQGGEPYVRQEEALILLLKKRRLSWREIANYFPYRSQQSIQNLYQRRLAPKAAAVSGTDGPPQAWGNALADRSEKHTPSRGIVAASSDELSTSADGSRLRSADMPSEICSVDCIPESPDHAVQEVEERPGQRHSDHRHRSSEHDILESSGNDLRVPTAMPLRRGPAMVGVCVDPVSAKYDTSMQRSDPLPSALVADTEQSPSATSPEDANSTDLGLAMPNIFDELLQAADASWQSRAQKPIVIASRASSGPHNRPAVMNARVVTSPPTSHLDRLQAVDAGPHSLLHELERPRTEGSLARDQLQSDLSASIHSHKSAITITRKPGIFKDKDKTMVMTTKHTSPDSILACDTPEKSATPPPATHPTPSNVSDSHKDKRRSLDPAASFTSRTPKHVFSNTTQSTLSSPSRLKTPVPRRSTIGRQSSTVKSASVRRRFVETSMREIGDSEDELA
jgi:hypothetical protein